MTRAALAAVLLLTGCTTYWTHPTGGNWATDSYECRREATVPAAPTMLSVPLGRGLYSTLPIGGGTEVDGSLMAECLRLRGWVETAPPSTQAAAWEYRPPPRDTSKDCPWGQYYDTRLTRCVLIGDAGRTLDQVR